LVAAASGLHAALARVLLMRVAPAARYPDAPGALARLLLWCALVSPLPAAALAAIPAATAGWAPAVQGFVFWWLASAAGTAVLLPFMLSLAHPPPVERGLFRSRCREALPVLAITALAAAIGWQTGGMFPLLLAVPLLLWAALRLTFRITSFLCLLLAVLPMAETAAQLWPSGTPLGDVVRPGQAWPAGLMLVVVPTLFASLFAQKQRMGARTARAALQTLRAAMA
jgi:integral membrane sensor domain MASE1